MADNTPPTPPGTPPTAPGNTAGTTPAAAPQTGQTGLLASALTPVAPARPIATSAAHHGSTAPLATSADTTGRAGGESIPRALLLALVERWRARPALAQKKLEVEKEKARGLQVKENRSTQATTQSISKNERRSDGRTEARSLGEHKNHRQDQHKSDGRNHRDTRSAGTTSRQDRNDHKNERRHDGKNHHTRDHKGSDTGEHRRRSDRKEDRKDHRQADTKSHRGHDRKEPGRGNATDHRTGDRSDHRKTDTRAGGQDGRTPNWHPSRGVLGGLFKRKGDHGKTSAQAVRDTVSNGPAHTGRHGPGDQPDRSKKPDPKSPKEPHRTSGPDRKDQPRTKPAREAGYRDGHRAGVVVQHAKAYRDGVRDGWTDAAAQGAREKQALDTARARRQKALTTQQKQKQKQEQPVPPTTQAAAPATTDTAQPIQVTGVDKDGVTLGAGADRPYLTRGEVRTMKQFERRLAARAAQLATAAERTRGLKAHADAQAQRAQTLADLTRRVKGGASLLPVLDRLAEAAQQQAAKAGEIHTRALRAAEKAKAVAANVQRRDGLIYQAVMDSPETEPAELDFYKGN